MTEMSLRMVAVSRLPMVSAVTAVARKRRDLIATILADWIVWLDKKNEMLSCCLL